MAPRRAAAVRSARQSWPEAGEAAAVGEATAVGEAAVANVGSCRVKRLRVRDAYEQKKVPYQRRQPRGTGRDDSLMLPR
jgi:hypothetical protein